LTSKAESVLIVIQGGFLCPILNCYFFFFNLLLDGTNFDGVDRLPAEGIPGASENTQASRCVAFFNAACAGSRCTHATHAAFRAKEQVE
jgi:hypothetical protein